MAVPAEASLPGASSLGDVHKSSVSPTLYGCLPWPVPIVVPMWNVAETQEEEEGGREACYNLDTAGHEAGRCHGIGSNMQSRDGTEGTGNEMVEVLGEEDVLRTNITPYTFIGEDDGYEGDTEVCQPCSVGKEKVEEGEGNEDEREEDACDGGELQEGCDGFLQEEEGSEVEVPEIVEYQAEKVDQSVAQAEDDALSAEELKNDSSSDDSS